MKVGNMIAIGLGLLFVWNFTQLGVATATVSVVFQNLQIKDLSNWIITFMIENVANGDIKINSMIGDVSMNGNALGTVKMFTPITVPGNNETPIPVVFQPSLLNLPTDVASMVKDLVTGSGQTYDFKVTGYINVSGLPTPIPFTTEQSFTV